ncbi:hypothetical protein MPSEU_000062200 [Mayamaea pseudoterrestris]|nr:hypothetical protein MPSEU_000062200 [Mayamaea pseudoterrestris]
MSPPERAEDGRPPRQQQTNVTSPRATAGLPPPSPHSPTRSDLGTYLNSGGGSGLENPMVGGANSLQQLPPLPPVSKHNRTVSWEVSGAPMSTVVKPENEDEDVSHISNPEFLRQNDDGYGEVLVNPLESEADRAIQVSLDDLDPTKAGPSDAQVSILGLVPQDTDPDTFSGTADNGGNNGTSKITKPSLRRAVTYAQGTRKTEDAAESLFQLGENLTMLNRQHGMSASKLHAHEKIDASGSNDYLSDQDKLMRNAVNLIQRNKEEPKEVKADTKSSTAIDSGSDDTKDVSVSSAQDRWKALKSTLTVTTAIDQSKKSDEGSPASPGAASAAAAAATVNAEGQGDNKDNSSDSNEDDDGRRSSSPGRSRHVLTRKQKLKSRYKDFEDWISFKRMNVYSYLKVMIFFIVLPAIGVACILFYLGGNPPCGTKSQCIESLNSNQEPAINDTATNSTGSEFVDVTRQIFGQASASWWILFVCCRQPVTFTLALATQAFVIEFLALRTKWAVKMVGPFVTLFIVQSKGWPFIVFWWAIYNFVMLYGPSRWARHWLFWQNVLNVFNEVNPAGVWTSSKEYRTVLICAMVIPLVVAIKRFTVGFWFGKKTYYRYADDLTTVMRKSLLVGLVAGLARELEEQDFELADLGLDVGRYEPQEESNNDDVGDESKDSRNITHSFSQGNGPSPSRGSSILRKANSSSIQKIRIDRLLGAWEEPEVAKKTTAKAPIAAIIQFRQSLSYLNTAFPFSVAFGPASNRMECITSTEAVYKRLTGTERVLRFDVIASLAVQRNGEMDEDTLKALIRLFRPERDGSLGLVHFAKAIDTVYKELRLLRASVANSTKMDASFEAIFNVVFYFIIICIVLAVIGIDPVVIFASVSGFAIGFAFMIGSAAAKFFEGLLFIIIRKPYDIGDRINVSEVTRDTDYAGAPGWIVKDVDLFTTTVLYASTNEVATYANSSLAACRIINAARSPKAVVVFMIKFPLDTSYKKLKVYKGAVEEFIKARPREWRSLLAFRAERVVVDAGFVEYVVVGEHRCSWQETGDVLVSKANLTSFCLELSKKMNMRYASPSMPIDLTIAGGSSRSPLNTILERPRLSPATSDSQDGGQQQVGNRDRSNTIESVDWRAVSAMFEQKK